MKAGLFAGAVMLLMLSACGRDASPPSPPSPGNPPKPKTESSVTTEVRPIGYALPARAEGEGGVELVRAPGALPAAERHFEVFRRMQSEQAITIQARVREEGLHSN
jgi:hypothetical protein